MTRTLPLCLMLATLLAAGCQREQAATPAADATATPATVAAPATTSVAVAPAAPAVVDATTLPGTFRATLPCADCPGIDVKLELRPDGRFVLTQVMQEQKDGTTVQEGTWALDADKRLHLQGEGAGEQLYAADSVDRLVQLGRDGSRSGTGSDPALERSPTP